jgi:rod shape-determining protein MreC
MSGTIRNAPLLVLSGLDRLFTRVFASGEGSGDANLAPEALDQISKLEQENADLRATLVQMQGENLQLRRKLQAIAQLEEFRLQDTVTISLADVVLSRDVSDWHSSLLINRGSMHGMKAGFAVVWNKTVVGEIGSAGPMTARVRLCSDPAFRVKAFLVPPAGTSPSARIGGILEGTGNGMCRMKFVFYDSGVQAGWSVVTSADPAAGLPEGMLIGTVAKVSFAERGSHCKVDVNPAIKAEMLDSVLVLRPKTVAK